VIEKENSNFCIHYNLQVHNQGWIQIKLSLIILPTKGLIFCMAFITDQDVSDP